MTKIIQRHDTAANWTSINPVLAAGEMGVETDTNKFKFGDGATAWSSLAYATSGSGGGSGTTLTSTDGTTTYSKLALGDNLVVILPELLWTNPQMNSNSQDGYVASASVSSSISSTAIYKAFDKNLTAQDECWYTGPVSMPQWIMLECPEPVRLTRCMIMDEVKTPEGFKSGYIQGSNDGSTFDTLYTITDRASTAGLQTTYQINTDTYYKYLRVYCTASYGSGLSIQEIEFSGFIKSAAAVPTLNVNPATTTTLGGIKVGENLSITEDGTLSAGTEVFNKDAFNIVGSPTITDDGAASGFSTANYVQIPMPNLSTASTWTIQGKFSFGGALNTTEQDLLSSSASYRVIAVAICKGSTSANIGKLGFNIGTSTRWIDAGNSSSSLVLNNSYYFKIVFTGTSYQLFISEDGKTYTKEIDFESSVKLSYDSGYNFNLGVNRDATIAPWLGGIDLSKFKIIADGVTVFDGSRFALGQDVKTFTGYSDTGTLVLKSINGVLQWVAEA